MAKRSSSFISIDEDDSTKRFYWGAEKPYTTFYEAPQMLSTAVSQPFQQAPEVLPSQPRHSAAAPEVPTAQPRQPAPEVPSPAAATTAPEVPSPAAAAAATAAPEVSAPQPHQPAPEVLAAHPRYLAQPQPNLQPCYQRFRTIAEWNLGGDIKLTVVVFKNENIFVNIRRFNEFNRPTVEGVTLSKSTWEYFSDSILDMELGERSSSFISENSLIAIVEGRTLHLQNISKSIIFKNNIYKLKPNFVLLEEGQVVSLKNIIFDVCEIMRNQ